MRQLAAVWAIDRERLMFDELVALLERPLTEKTSSLYSTLISHYMDPLSFRYGLGLETPTIFAAELQEITSKIDHAGAG